MNLTEIKSSLLRITSILLVLFVAACEKNEPGIDDSSFDRKAMLEFYADEMIVPAYSQTLSQIEDLQSKAQAFTALPDSLSLINIQQSWKSAIISWQEACAFNFGPAGEDGLRKSLPEEIATFPVSTSKVEDFVGSGNFNLNDFNRDARGFFAIEYLIFDETRSISELVQRFSEENRKSYLNALVENLKTRLMQVRDSWTSSYRSEFVNNAGTDAGSSTSMLYNEFVKSYEGAKNFKLGLPLGLRPGQTSVDATLCEALYSGYSFNIIKKHFEVMENIWRGGENELGFRAYLKQVTGGDALIATTESQINLIHNALDAISDQTPMKDEILINAAPYISLHTELQKNTKNFKSDLSSLIGIAITYSSGDGD